jgi:hypothetical protein
MHPWPSGAAIPFKTDHEAIKIANDTPTLTSPRAKEGTAEGSPAISQS